MAGDVWTWTALDADSKLMVSSLVGGCDAGYTHAFIEDLAFRLAMRVQLTTDSQKLYLEAPEGSLGTDGDYAQLVKLCGEAADPEKRHSPAVEEGGEPRSRYGSALHVLELRSCPSDASGYTAMEAGVCDVGHWPTSSAS
jgi:hypothetical protein